MRGIDLATKGLISSGITTASRGIIQSVVVAAVVGIPKYIILHLTSAIRNVGIALTSMTEVIKK